MSNYAIAVLPHGGSLKFRFVITIEYVDIQDKI